MTDFEDRVVRQNDKVINLLGKILARISPEAARRPAEKVEARDMVSVHRTDQWADRQGPTPDDLPPSGGTPPEEFWARRER